MVKHHRGFEALHMGLHLLHQLRALQFRVATGPVLDFGGGGELPALLHARDHHWLQVGPRGVDGGGITRGAGAQNDQGVVLDVAHSGHFPVAGVK